jgi:DDE superfamily endonuclease
MDKFWSMITYEMICRQPQVVISLIGMSLAEFEKLYAEFELAHRARASALQHTRRHEAKRRRAVGAGRKHKYALRDRLLMALFWLRAYTTYEVLGFFYGLDKSSVADNLNDVLDTLKRMTTFNFERPQAEVPKLRSVQEVMDAFPEVRLMIDVKRQPME